MLLREIDVGVPSRADPRLIICEVPFEPPLRAARDADARHRAACACADVHEAIDLAVQAEHGYRHTAGMYSRNLDCPAPHGEDGGSTCSIFVKNAPDYAGPGLRR